MKKKLLVLLLFLHTIIIYGQVLTHHEANEYIATSGLVYQRTSEVNEVSSTEYKTDEIYIGNRIYSHFSLDNGEKEILGDTIEIWTLRIRVKEAECISIVFDTLILGMGDEMFIYSSKLDVIMGPFTSRITVTNTLYPTDLIESNDVIIEVHHRLSSNALPSVSINSIIAGKYTKEEDNDCFIHVNCPCGNEWELQKKGTCMLMRLGEYSLSPFASGVLLNNTSSDGTPYVLTDWHCTEGSFSDLSLWVFRFYHWRLGCENSSPANNVTISYSGATLADRWPNDQVNNDLALVKINNTPTVEDGLFYCGWDISGSVPETSVLLSHPAVSGNYMRIAISHNVINNGLWWKSIWSEGGAYGGSSGGPLFNQNHLVVGAHHGRSSNDCKANAYAGKLSFSATHRGENGTYITSWLDPRNTGCYVLEGMSRRPDLHVRDNLSDQGYEPNTSTTDYSYSPDIWITTTSGAAVPRIEEGGQYLVNVRVNNNDTIASSSNIRVKINWTRVSSNMNWGRAWNGGITHPCDQIRGGYGGERTLSAPIVAGGDGIVSIPWTVPARPTGLPHCSVLRYLNGLSYALLARVEDGHETVGEDLNDYNIRDFVLQNNNVAMKTYNIMQENIRDNVVAVDMRRDRGDGYVRIAYSSTANNDGVHISNVANVYLQFDSSMLAAWPQATRQMTGCRQVNDSVFVITDTTATFDGFMLDTAETYFISSYVRYRIPQADSTEHRFSLNFSIVDGDSVFADGDIDYTVMYDEAAYFNVTAYEDMTVMAGESFELSAEADAADATFEWYNMQDVLIGTGNHISLSSTSTQQYYVRGYSPSDNTVGYDTVAVTVRHGIITKITPNPAHNQVLVKYTLADDVTNPTISLRNSNGMVVYSASIGTHPALCHINIKTIDVVPLPTGNYTVSLEDNGVVLDSKTLVVQ